MLVRVLIRPKEGILDPQGKAVERALPTLGFEGVRDVRVGRLVELEIDGIGSHQASCTVVNAQRTSLHARPVLTHSFA